MSTVAIVGQAIVGEAVVGDVEDNPSLGVWLYTPPWYEQRQRLAGSLTYKIATSTTVYRIGGVWYNALSPGMSNPNPADCDVEPRTGLRLYFNKPMVIPGELHDGLAALEPANTAWNPGSLTLL